MDKLLKSFTERHELSESNAVLPMQEASVNALAHAFHTLNELHDLSLPKLEAQPTMSVLQQLLHRNFEHVEAAQVAIVTGSGSAAEVMARVSMECSASARYIMRDDVEARCMAFLRDFVNGEASAIDKWRKSVEKASTAERAVHSAALERREEYAQTMRGVVDVIAKEMGSPPEKGWPTAFDRFKDIGEAVAYRTMYARLSSSTHTDAEETLRFIIGKVHGGEEMLERMGFESVQFARMLIGVATEWFIDSVVAFAKRYADGRDVTRLRELRESVARETHEAGIGAGGVA